MASGQSSITNNPDSASKNNQRSKTSVIRSFIHRRANSEGGVSPPPFNFSFEIFQPMGAALDAHETLLSKPLAEIQQNQVDHSQRPPRKSREDSCLGSKINCVSTGFAPEKSNSKDINRNGSPVKPMKTKSSMNLAGLLGKPKSLKSLKKTVEQEEKNKENRTPMNESLQSTLNPPIYIQFATAGLGSQDDYVSFPQLPGSSKSDPRNGIPKLCQGSYASKQKFDLPRPGLAAKGSAKASMDVGEQRQTLLEEPIGGSQRPHCGSRPISIAHPPPRTQSKQDLRKQRPNEPFIDPGEVDTHLEVMLDRRNIPENQRYKMRNLSDTVKIEFIRQDWAEAAGAAKDTSNGRANSVLRSADLVYLGAGPDEATKESKEGKKMSRARSAVTLTKPRRGGKDSAPASPTKRTAIGTLGRHFRSKSSESVASALDRPNSAGSTSSGRTGNSSGSGAAGLIAKATGRRENTAVEHVSYLKKTPKPEIVEVGKLHKLRLLLRNETVAWTEDFIRQGGMKEIVALLYRIMDVEWREEHEDALLHETLLCLKALCTVALGLQYLHKVHEILFPALLKMLFDPEKKGPAEFTTRGIITSVMFRYIEAGSTPSDRMSRAKDVVSYLRDPKPVEAEQPVGFVLEMRKDRPYRVWCKEVVSVTKEVFWIFLHNLNVVPLPGEGNCKSKSAMGSAAGPATNLTDAPVTSSTSVYFLSPEQGAQAQYITAYFPKERPPVAAAPYVGGVEWDATNYLASHLDLLNAIIACTPTFSARNSLRSQLRISGFEKCLGGSLRLCKEKFYGAVHDGLRTWVAAAHADAWDVRDVRYGPPPPPENARSRSQSPFKKAKRQAEPPRIEMPQLNFELEQPRSAGQLPIRGQSGAEGRNDTRSS